MILYFSGTGNCKYVAEQIAAAVGGTAVSVEDSDGKITLKKGEIFGIVFPTHFWELPAIMREFLEKASITAERENYAFAVATYGTTPGREKTTPVPLRPTEQHRAAAERMRRSFCGRRALISARRSA